MMTTQDAVSEAIKKAVDACCASIEQDIRNAEARMAESRSFGVNSPWFNQSLGACDALREALDNIRSMTTLD